LVERLIRNQQVSGSIPEGGSTLFTNRHCSPKTLRSYGQEWNSFEPVLAGETAEDPFSGCVFVFRSRRKTAISSPQL
jgi:hypothetical protein